MVASQGQRRRKWGVQSESIRGAAGPRPPWLGVPQDCCLTRGVGSTRQGDDESQTPARGRLQPPGRAQPAHSCPHLNTSLCRPEAGFSAHPGTRGIRFSADGGAPGYPQLCEDQGRGLGSPVPIPPPQEWEGNRQEAPTPSVRPLGGQIITDPHAHPRPPDGEGGWPACASAPRRKGLSPWPLCSTPFCSLLVASGRVP